MDATSAERAVVQLFDSLFTTLTRERDAEAGTRLFVADEDIVMWGSDQAEQAVGPAAVGELHRGIAASPADLDFRWHSRHVHVEGDTAWVNAAGTVTVARRGAEAHGVPYRVTAIFVRRADEWRWHTFSGSEPNPSA
jgi:ketosteroid isomerase-like protein